MSDRDAYIQRMKIQLDELQSGIDKLEGKAHIAEVTVMTAYQSEMSALRLQWQKASAKLDQVKAAGETTWEYLQAEMEKAFHALADAFQDFRSRN